MDLDSYNFDLMNETDVREEIIAPLLRTLGYRAGTVYNVIREQPLAYPRLQLGRRKPTDPVVRGRADYICEVEGRIRWVIEAKPPREGFSRFSEEQSWTYANHPAVRAVYHCVTNGREFRIYQTNRGPEAEPIFRCTYAELAEATVAIRNVLSPDALLRDYPDVKLDTDEPLGPGLRSVARLTNGIIVYEGNSLEIQPLTGLTMSMRSGSVERAADRTLRAFIETVAPYEALQRFNEKLGLHSLQLISADARLSVDSRAPTIFEGETAHMIPAGEAILDLATWEEMVLAINVPVAASTRATGVLEDRLFFGRFEAVLNVLEVELEVAGRFEVHLA